MATTATQLLIALRDLDEFDDFEDFEDFEESDESDESDESEENEEGLVDELCFDERLVYLDEGGTQEHNSDDTKEGNLARRFAALTQARELTVRQEIREASCERKEESKVEKELRLTLQRRPIWCQTSSTADVREWLYSCYPPVFWNLLNLSGESRSGPHPGSRRV